MLQFYFLLNTITFSRLFYGFKNEAVSGKRLFFILLFQITMIFFFQPGLAFFILLFLIVAGAFLVYVLERELRNLNASRILTFIFYLFIIGIITSPSAGMVFNAGLIKFLSGLKEYFSLMNLFANVDWFKVNVISAAVLFLLNESNYFIRFFFELFRLTHFQFVSGDVFEIDSREYNAGRIIGMLERMLIFFFVLSNQYAAIGFIIAAKGFTRFKELDNKSFAEYVLIGTFLSSLTAIILALLVKNILLSF